MFLTSLQCGSRGQTLGGLPNAQTHVLQRIVIKIFILRLKIWPSPQVCHLYKQLHLLPCHLPPDFQTEKKPKEEEKMSDWVVLDISAMTKTTNREKVLKVLKAGGMTVCKVTDQYMSPTK